MEINPNFSPNAKHDFHLVSKAQQGDQKAYADLMARYQNSIYFLILKMIHSKDDAMDLTMETFGKAFQNLDRYNPNFAFSTWLYRIANNNSIDFLRKKKMKLVSIHQDDEDTESQPLQVKSDTPDPEELKIKKDQKEQLQVFVDQLPSRYKTLIKMRYYEELSYEEIAEQLDIPLGTVKAQLHRARNVLMDVINKTKKTTGLDF